MTIFSFILIGIIIKGFFKKNLKQQFIYFLTVTIALSLNLRMGIFIAFGSFELGYGSALVYITAIFALLLMISYKFNLTFIDKAFLCFVLFLIINVICFFVFPYTEKVISTDWEKFCMGEDVYTTLSSSSLLLGYYALFICLGLILICSKRFLKRADWLKILNNVLLICKINIVLGIIEFLAKNIFQSQIITDTCINIFGSYGAQQNELDLRGLFYTIQGATKEASMYTTTMFYTVLLFMIKNKLNNFLCLGSTKIWMTISFILILLNTTMSSMLYIVLLAIIGISHKLIFFKNLQWNNRRFVVGKLVLCLIAGATCFVLFSEYKVLLASDNYIIKRLGLAAEQIINIFNGDLDFKYSSESIRFTGIFYDLSMWLKKPLIGFGFGTLVCNSGIITMLVNVGIVGIILWFVILLNFSKSNKVRFREIVFLLEIWLLPSLILNDYETISCLVIPLIALLYGYLVEEQRTAEPTFKQDALLTACANNRGVI